jgi:hypothetical protein
MPVRYLWLLPFAMRWGRRVADLEGILGRLARHRVKFVVVGGFAAVAHGVTLITLDVDVCCPMTAANVLRIHESLSDLHPFHRFTPNHKPFAVDSNTAKGWKNINLQTDLGPLDVLGEVPGVGSYSQVRHRTRTVRLPFGPCRILDLDALIVAKTTAGRPRDKEAVVQLRAIRERKQRRR